MDCPGPRLVVDLTRSGTQTLWGDGTLYEDTEVSQYHSVINDDPPTSTIYIFKEDYLTDGSPDFDRQFLCQINPLGLNW